MMGKHAVQFHCDSRTYPMRTAHPVEEIWIALLEIEGVKHRGQGLSPAGAATNLVEKIAHYYDPPEEREERPTPPIHPPMQGASDVVPPMHRGTP